MEVAGERERIVRGLSELPSGSIVTKRIRGRDQPCLQWREGGKVRSCSLKAAERKDVERQIERRRELSARLWELEATQGGRSDGPTVRSLQFETTVRVGPVLRERLARG